MMKSKLSILFVLVVLCLCPVYGDPFKIAVLPDTQSYSNNYPATFTAQTNWIVNNKTAQSIAFVTHLGDIVNNGAQSGEMYQWTNADNAIDILDGDLPYSVCIGNHDYDVVSDKNDPFNGADTYKSYFGSSRYSSYAWYGGTSPLGLSHYQIFTAGGRQWLHLNIEWEPDNSILMWAQQVIDDHNTLPVIISTHSFIGLITNPLDANDVGFRSSESGDAANGSLEMWYKFISHNDQIFMVLCGHRYGEQLSSMKNDYGKDVFFMLSNYQDRENGGNGSLRLLEFDDTNNQIKATTYSPTLDTYETDANSQFTFNVNFNTRFNFGSREQINGIKAANIKVTNNPAFDVNVIPGQTTGDIGLVPAGTNSYTGQNKGDYYVQVGQRCEDDTMAGVLIASIAQNGSFESGITWYHTPASNIWGHGQISVGVQITDFNGPDGYGGWYLYTDNGEGDANAAVAYFPFSQFIGAHCEELVGNKIYSAMGNGVVFGENLLQYPNSNDDPCLVIPHIGGNTWSQTDGDRGIFEFNLPGVNSLTDGIILANTNDNGDNYITVSPHEDGSGWQLATLDNSGTSGTECSGFSFVYVPYSTPDIVAGRFKANSGKIVAGTGGFKAEPIVDGKVRLKIVGCTPADGALLVVGENQWYNSDNFHVYAPDDANGCWIIESRDLPQAQLAGTTTEHYVFAFIPFDGNSTNPPFDGNGTPANPFKIYTRTQLEAVDWWPAAHFRLMNNINLAGTTYTNSLIAIDSNTAFTGSFDGYGYAIQNLTINAVGRDRIGLFGEIGTEGHVSNLTLQDANIANTSQLTGALAGICRGSVSNCHITGSVQANYRTGGLAGFCSGAITNCDSSASVTGGERVGGLIGDCYSLTATNCHATGNVGSTGPKNVGGFIGMCDTATLNSCYATGSVTGGTGTDNVGGLIGVMTNGSVSGSYASGNVTSGGYYIGGFVGYNKQGSVASCHSSGTVFGTSAGTEGHHVGGFVGYHIGADGYIAVISNCYATGNVTGTKLSGGFVGRALSYSSISSCYATGNAVSTGDVDDAEAGGFAGRLGSGSTTSDCYATGSATGKARVGGFTGRIESTTTTTVTNCYSTGAPSGTSYIRGFCGYGAGIVTSCFWDTDTSGTTLGGGGTGAQIYGKTTVQMKMQSTFTGWDFTTPLWKIRETLSYPKLNWQTFAGGDIDYSDTIDFADLKIIADNWLATGTDLPGDIHVDANNIVNFLDFADFAEDWCEQ